MAHLKKFFLISVLVVCLSLLALPGASVAKDQTKCPVMGGLINKNLYADYQGNRVYFCCPPCLRSSRRTLTCTLRK